MCKLGEDSVPYVSRFQVNFCTSFIKLFNLLSFSLYCLYNAPVDEASVLSICFPKLVKVRLKIT